MWFILDFCRKFFRIPNCFCQFSRKSFENIFMGRIKKLWQKFQVFRLKIFIFWGGIGVYLAVCLIVYCIIQRGVGVYLGVCWIVLDSILQNIRDVGVFLGVCWIVFCTFGVGGCLKSKFVTKYWYMSLFCTWTSPV